jgi:DeoR family fructose operon transcriptional repressor
MSYSSRKEKILQLLSRKGEISIPDVLQQLDVSAVTARRDLDKLAMEGLLTRTHGGAIVREQSPLSSFVEKNSLYQERKAYIARLAAAFIKEGDSLMLDCGSTVYHLIPLIRDIMQLKVVTNSVPVMLALMDSPVEVHLVGGLVDKQRQAVHGQVAEAHILNFRVDKAFLGADGVSLGFGLSAKTEVERGNTLAMMQAARHNFFLLDSAKFEKDALIKITDWPQAHHLITDNKLPNELVNSYREAGIRLINR